MSIRSKLLLVVVGMLLVLGMAAACTSAPLPPMFFMGAPRAEQPAPPVALAPVEEPTLVVEPVVAVEPTVVAAPAITETVELTTTAGITLTVEPSAEVTATIASTAAMAVTPTVEAAAAAAVQPTATATRVAPTRALPTATRAPARPTATPAPQWPQTLVITAEEIEQGATSVPGLQVTGLDVQFGNNAMTMRFDTLRYSLLSLRNVTIEGRFVVNNCDVDFVADRITPRNLATGAIPGFINQSLDQQLGAWCVESLTVQPGRLEASVRPR